MHILTLTYTDMFLLEITGHLNSKIKNNTNEYKVSEEICKIIQINYKGIIHA